MAVLLTLVPTYGDVSAQSLRSQCAGISRADVRTFCENVADAATIVQPRLGMALTGGNPVPGTASTLGNRLRTLPRMSIALRVTAAELDLPPIERVTTRNTIEFAVGSIAADASVGVFPGFSLTPDIGGFASLDLLGSIGTIPLPRGEGFDDSSPFTWAAGARLGLLRESFAAPGASVSVMVRRLGDFAYGSANLTDRDAHFNVSDYAVTSWRGVVGKRLLGVGLVAGVGYDRSSADLFARVRDPDVLNPSRTRELRESDVSESRASLFGNASVNFLAFSAVAEIGFQQGGDAIEDATDKLGRSALFGGLAIRVGF
jgi:hypothetical protein